MKNSFLFAPIALFSLATLFSSCGVIEEIFKAGMGIGIFMILSVLVVVVFIIMQIRKK